MIHACSDLEANTRAQVERTKSSPFILRDLKVHGPIYQVEDGRLREVI